MADRIQRVSSDTADKIYKVNADNKIIEAK